MKTNPSPVFSKPITEQRRQMIAELTDERGTISSEELVNKFGVSHMTIWRDLTALEANGKLRRARGGAIRAAQVGAAEPDFASKRVVHATQKEAIARYAARELVQPGEILILEAGTTVTAMIKHLNQNDLTVVTNGLAAINEAAPSIPKRSVMSCGGILRDVSHTFIGPPAEQFFRSIRAHTFFLSATGLALPDGLTDPNPFEIQIKQAMAASAARVVLLMDSSKFGVRSLAQVLPLSAIHTLVTDAGAPESDLAELRELGIEVHCVP